MDLEGHGLVARLPGGWEGRISRERADDVRVAGVGGQVQPVAHLATFPLPDGRGDFGSGAVELMRDDDAFVALVEYAPEEAGSRLFARRGLPRRLDPRRFSTRSLQRVLAPQAGWQAFFNEGGRAFCLYVVLGDVAEAHLLVRRVEQVLAGVHIEART